MDQALLWGSEHTDLLTGFGIGFASLFILAYPFVVFRSRPRKVQTSDGETVMSMKRAEYYRQDHERRLRERQKICDAFEDSILTLYARGQISESTYNYWHGHFATLSSALDFRHVSLPASELKATLIRRRNGGSYHGIYAPVKLPAVDKEVQRIDAMKLFLSNFR